MTTIAASAIANPAIVPVIDIAPYLHGTHADKLRVAAQVDRACRQIGFYIIVGHGVERTLIDQMEATAFALFALPLEEKMRFRRSDEAGAVGYAGVGENNLSYTHGEAKPHDLNETWQIAPINVTDDPYFVRQEARALFPANRWPERPAGFKEVSIEYFRKMSLLANDLMRLSALALGIHESYFDDKIDKQVSRLNFRLYPDQNEDPLPGQLRAAAHTDFGTVTILKPGNAPGGLQVVDPDGNWHDVPVIPGSYVINLGDLFPRWTNNQWRSTLHRVVNPPVEARTQSRRLSIVFFGHPNYDVTVSCLPTCVEQGRPARYDPIRVSDYYLMKQDQRRTAKSKAVKAAGS